MVAVRRTAHRRLWLAADCCPWQHVTDSPVKGSFDYGVGP
jgi:hypothetical protein